MTLKFWIVEQIRGVSAEMGNAPHGPIAISRLLTPGKIT
jgi:hypothetical protein